MANSDGIFNIARGKIGYYLGLPAASDAIIVVLLKSAGLQADATLADHDDLAAILAASNDECDFTNYARKTATSVTLTVDDTNDRADGDFADLTWASAGNGTNNAGGKLLVCYDGDTGAGTDADIVPLTFHVVSFTTDGTDLTITVPSQGFWRSA